MTTQIILRSITGISRLQGICQNNCSWIQFETDYLAEQIAGECSICNAEIENGWLCLDGGEEVCDRHVSFEEDTIS